MFEETSKKPSSVISQVIELRHPQGSHNRDQLDPHVLNKCAPAEERLIIEERADSHLNHVDQRPRLAGLGGSHQAMLLTFMEYHPKHTRFEALNCQFHASKCPFKLA